MPLPHTQSAPVGTASRGLLQLQGGANHLSLRPAEPVEGLHGTAQPLFVARFQGALPAVQTQEGAVAIAYSPFRFWWPPHHRREADIALTGAVPWRVQLRGGVGFLEADLRTLRLQELELERGAGELRLVLPRPTGTLRVRIRGGVSRLSLLRPEWVPLKLTVHGGASHIRVDTLSLGSVGGSLAWESPSYAAATSRLEVELLGGLSHATFGTVQVGEGQPWA